MPKVRFPTKMRAAMAGVLPCCLESGRFGHRQGSFSTPHDGLRGPPRHSGSPRRTCRRGAETVAHFVSTYWQSAWLHWTLVMHPETTALRNGTGRSAIPQVLTAGGRARRSPVRPSAPAVLSLAYREPRSIRASALHTRASGCAAEPLEMLGKLRGLDVLDPGGPTWSIGIRARPRASTP